jgi:hypothetical protein
MMSWQTTSPTDACERAWPFAAGELRDPAARVPSARRIRLLSLGIVLTGLLPWAMWPMLDAVGRWPSFTYAWWRADSRPGLDYADLAVTPALLAIVVAALVGRMHRPAARLVAVAASLTTVVICVQVLVDLPLQWVTPCLGALLAAGFSVVQVRAVTTRARSEGGAPPRAALGAVLIAVALLGDWLAPLTSPTWWNPTRAIVALVAGVGVVWAVLLVVPLAILVRPTRFGRALTVAGFGICLLVVGLDVAAALGAIADGDHTARIGPAAPLYLLGGWIGMRGRLAPRPPL